MTDFDRIKNAIVENENKSADQLANVLLELFISIAGERLIEKERVRRDIYKSFLQNKMVKPEFYKTVYNLMMKSEEKLDG